MVGAADLSLVARLAVAGLGSLTALLGTTAVASAAGPENPAAAPRIASFKVTPSPLSAEGGKVTATAKVQSGRTCTFSITPREAGFPVKKRCGSGTVSATLRLGPNKSTSTRHFTIRLSVMGASRTVTASKALAQPALTLSGVKTVAGEGQSYCALLTNGRVYCWGANSDGQLGDGTKKNSSRPVAVTAVGGTGALAGVASIVSDTLGYGSEYCAVLRAGGVDCWGFNGDGQLGNGTTKDSDEPVAVRAVGGSGLLGGVTMVQPGIYGFCAALSSGGAVCWGLNDDGELGDNSATGPDTCGTLLTPCATTPVTVVGTGGTGSLGGVASLTGEAGTMCALLTSSGVDCWGDGSDGQLGDGSESASSYPAVVEGAGGTGTLTGVTSLTGYKDNGTSICARLASGHADCWGEDTWGELGNGTTGILNDSPVPVAVEGVGGHGTLSAVSSVTGVPDLTNCAVLSSGGADCWGNNEASVLGGLSSAASSNVPVKVAGTSGKGVLGGIASLVAGTGSYGGNVCAVLASGGVDCWGYASSGYSPAPKAVPGFGAAKPSVRVRGLVSDDDGSTCAVLATGGVDCWGQDAVGQLGDGPLANSLVPEAVLAPAA
jgi:alpha-tubulin suppressor-like RCC1 family protein